MLSITSASFAIATCIYVRLHVDNFSSEFDDAAATRTTP